MKLIFTLVMLLSGAAVAEEEVSSAPKAFSLKYSVFGFFSNAGGSSFDNVSFQSGAQNGTGNAVVNFDTAAGLGIEFGEKTQQAWGWAAGVMYDTKRSMVSSTATYSGAKSTAVYNAPMPSLTILTIYGNAVRTFDKFYVFAGLNRSIPFFEKGSLSGDMTLSGSIGFQAGGGFQATENISLEVMYRSLYMTATRQDQGVSFNLGGASLSGLQAQLKYTF